MATSTRAASSSEEAAAAPESLRREFEDLGLSSYEARMLLALLAAGSASTPQLGSASGIPRTSAYQVLQSLAAKRLVERLPGDWPAMWASPGRDEVLDRLVAAQEERLASYRERTEHLRGLLADMPGGPSVAMPYVHLLRGPAHVRRCYDQLLTEAKVGFEMFTRSPYAYALGQPNPAVIEALERGVRSRVLYEESEWNDPKSEDFRAEMAVYHGAGVQARLAPELEIKLVVVDRKLTLVGMDNPFTPDEGYPTFFLVEHPGYAAVQSDAFEQRWASAKALDVPAAPDGASASA